MSTETMGKVIVAAKIDNVDDISALRRGKLAEDQVRRVEVTDALIDSGATGLLVPARLIGQLGLDLVRSRSAKTIMGSTTLKMYSAVRLTVQGRDCTVDVTEISDNYPVIIGQIPLEAMDWVIDMRGRRLIGNPAHGGEEMIEVL